MTTARDASLRGTTKPGAFLKAFAEPQSDFGGNQFPGVVPEPLCRQLAPDVRPVFIRSQRIGGREMPRSGTLRRDAHPDPNIAEENIRQGSPHPDCRFWSQMSVFVVENNVL